MTSTPFFDRLAHTKLFTWWTLALWVLFVASVKYLGHITRAGADYLVISWWIAGVAGTAAGVIGLRGRRVWLTWALLAAVVLVVSSGAYWSLLVERLMPQDERNAITTVLQRIWQMAGGGLQAGIRDGTLHWALATVYREMLMPILQLLTLAIIGGLWIAMRARAEGRA